MVRQRKLSQIIFITFCCWRDSIFFTLLKSSFMHVTEDSTEMLKLCTSSGDVLQNCLLIPNQSGKHYSCTSPRLAWLYCSDLGSSAPVWLWAYSREGFLLFILWENKLGAIQRLLLESKLPRH